VSFRKTLKDALTLQPVKLFVFPKLLVFMLLPVASIHHIVTLWKEFFWEMFSIILFRPRCYHMNLPSSEKCKTRKILMINNYIDLCVAHSTFSAFISVRDLPWLSLWCIELASQSFTTCLHPSIFYPLMLPLPLLPAHGTVHIGRCPFQSILQRLSVHEPQTLFEPLEDTTFSR
jgi:hypothetical protein